MFGFFCVRLTKIYFAMLTLAFSQIVWAICFKWNDVTGGDQGLPDVPYPDLDWMSAIPGLGDLRIGDRFYLLTLMLVASVASPRCAGSARSPFGRMLTTIRDNPERAAFIGVNVRAYELAAFVIAGGFAGLAGALFGIFNRGVFADYVYWPKSAEVMIMTILGGMDYFWGPPVGAAALVLLNQQITSYTEYWPFVLGTILLVLLFVFPGGIVGGARRRRSAAPRSRMGPPMLEVRRLSKSFAGFVAVADVEPDRGERQIAAVIGPNGAGKSTLFNLITGHLQPDARPGAVDGRDITGVAPHGICRHGDRPLVPAHQHLPALSVFENVQAALLAHRGRGRNFWSRVGRLLPRREPRRCSPRSGSPGRRTRSPARCRYGNQKQLELGIALASDPKLLLLDEPTAGMSASETHETIALLDRIAARARADAAVHRARHGGGVLDRAEDRGAAPGPDASPKATRPRCAPIPRCAASISARRWTAMMTALLALEDIHTAYGLSRVLFGVSLEVDAGECVCLLGPQRRRQDDDDALGHGPDAAERGRVRLAGARHHRLVAASRGARRDRLRAGGSPHLRRAHGVGKSRSRRARRGAARALDDRGRSASFSRCLASLRDRQGGFLSGGEQQMLTIARTLMGNPELLLLDEPSEGLAPLVVEALLAKIGELKAQGLTILLAEQGVEFSLALADRVYVLEKGAVRFSGAAAALRSDRTVLDQLLTL